MWLRSDTILWTGIGMNTATTPALVLRTRTEPEALERWLRLGTGDFPRPGVS